uniref:Ion_trans_2 domain-containing protein n=1 Tax=Rhodnius prolixus TaxID=13249 RepID=T1HER3_RHOPR
MGTFGEKNLHIYNISLLHKMYEPKSNATIIRKFTERYGSSTPQTPSGQVAVIVYGFIGCSGGILFFNLFLERLISLLALLLGHLHVRQLKKAGKELDEEDPLDDWKPNVYLVLLCLVVGSVTVALAASFLYTTYEGWTFIESLYFCFVSFSTIGFGDYVATQQTNYPNYVLYRIGNFLLVTIGCCFIYSLFNVTSIVIKQAMNWMLLRLDCHHCGRASDKATKMLRRHSLKIQHRARRRSSFALPKTIRKKSDSGVSTTDSSGRRLSGEISMKEFLGANKVSLAVMQKQLYETAMLQRGYHSNQQDEDRFRPGMVGPLSSGVKSMTRVRTFTKMFITVSSALYIVKVVQEGTGMSENYRLMRRRPMIGRCGSLPLGK